MRLIGMLDSPYVRRVAVSLKLMGIDFTHDQISVFRAFDEFQAINPVVKAPSLVTDDGVVLMDSSLILEHAERIAGQRRSLMPSGPREHLEALHVIGLQLAACEKAVQIIYEHNQRPPEKWHQPWLDRVQTQLLGAHGALEKAMAPQSSWFGGDRLMQADITVAVGWRFMQHYVPEIVTAAAFPHLAAHSARAEALPAFIETAF
ncbi:MAG: glutathione S-transferase [Pseudomonadota bacterium]